MPKQKYIPDIFNPEFYDEVKYLTDLNAKLKEDIKHDEFNKIYYTYLEALKNYQKLINE